MQGERSGAARPFGPIWKEALSDVSGAKFREVATPDVRLEGSIFAAPIEGRDNVWTSFRTAAGITDGLTFVDEATASDRTFLTWEQEALGRRAEGVTVVGFDSSGLVDNVAIHHRPLGVVLAFSAEMGRRLGDSVGPGVFYQPESS
jgi:hypothetical protein